MLATGISTNLYDFIGTAGESHLLEGVSDSSADAVEAKLFGFVAGVAPSYQAGSSSNRSTWSTMRR